MGINIEKTEFSKEDYSSFQLKLSEQLKQLKQISSCPSFGQQELHLGAELEMYLVDAKGEVKPNNTKILKSLQDEQFQPELNKYNIELNLSPQKLSGKPFSLLLNEIELKTNKLIEIADTEDTQIVPIGILPTLRKEHLEHHNMTDTSRYRCLAKHLYQQRGENFQININGEDPLSIDFNNICAEGANTSFQVHLMTKPNELADTFNAAMLTSPFVMSLSGNSPIFLGNELWEETRIALFKQSLDIRLRDSTQWQQPTRVNFGHGWVRKNILECFEEAVALYPPLIPFCSSKQQKHSLPDLSELSLHLGTIWPWHRPVYSAAGNGHIRIEFRAIPAGPTNLDMVANAAFAIGLAAGFQKDIDKLLSSIPFKFAEYNFYRAAQCGLEAKILWPNKHGITVETPIKRLLPSMILKARQGLERIGVVEEEAKYFIDIIEQRLKSEITGATWQKRTLSYLKSSATELNAYQKLTQLYIENCRSNSTVTNWERKWT